MLLQKVGCLLLGDAALGRLLLAHQRDPRVRHVAPEAGLVFVVLKPGASPASWATLPTCNSRSSGQGFKTETLQPVEIWTRDLDPKP